MKKLLLVFLFFVPFLLRAQIISTFAGTGATTYSGDNVPATAAGIPDPIGGIFDKFGNYYFADGLSSHRIRKIDVTGMISTVAGNGSGGFSGDSVAATATELYQPQAVTLDTFGNLYIADEQNSRIRKVDRVTGLIYTIAGNGTGAFYGEGIPATVAEIWGPQDICIDKSGNLYIADAFNHRVRKIDPSGNITTFAGNGTPGSSGDGNAATMAELWLPTGVASDNEGYIFIAEHTGNRVRKVNISGVITTVAGNGTAAYIGDGMPATDAQISPIKVAIDAVGQLYMADEYNRRVYEVDNSGIIHLIAGDGTTGYSGDGIATAAAVDYPGGVTFDVCGNLYIPGVDSRRILKVVFNPTCSIPSLQANTIENETINIYPNPTTNLLQIDNLPHTASYSLLTIVGATMQQGTLHRGSNTIALGTLPTGMYLLQLIDEQGNRSVSKVMKE